MSQRSGILLLLAAALIRLPAAAQTEDTKREAREHFERGVELLEQGADAAALAEFQRSRELYPTRGNTQNAAVALRKLHRYDEALDLFESMLRDFPNLTSDERAQVEREIELLAPLVGTLDVKTEPRATVIVDGRERGTTPLPAPLRVAVGTHVVRVTKAGFVPWERRLELAGRQALTLTAPLAPLAAPGAPAPPPPATPAPAAPPPPGPEPSPQLAAALALGPAVAPALGGDLAARCEGECAGGLPFGGAALVRAGIELPSRIGFGAELGFVQLSQKLERRPDPIRPVGFTGEGSADDDLRWRALCFGVNAWSRSGEDLILTLELGAGVAAVTVRDRRSGRYAISNGQTIAVSAEQTPRGWYAYLAPGARLGLPLTGSIDAGIGLRLLGLVALSPPRWDDEELSVSAVGFASFPDDSLSGELLLIAVPVIGAGGAF